MRGLKIAALVLGALILIPSGAHVLELAPKLAMDRDAYFLAQRLYIGWALFAIPIVAASVIDLLLWRTLRTQAAGRARFALASAIAIAAGLVVFFVKVYPANRATLNWTAVPGNWESLRIQWEYGHADIAALTLAAFVCVVLASVSPSRHASGRG